MAYFLTVKSIRSRMFFNISVLTNFPIFTRKYLCWGLFLIKLQAFRLLRNCSEHLFLQNTSGGCLWTVKGKRTYIRTYIPLTNIWTNLFSFSSDVSERWICSPKSDTSSTAKTFCFRYSLLGLMVEVTHCISAGEHKHYCQLHCNCITNVIMNLRYIQKLVFLRLLKPVMIGKTRCQYMYHTYQDISIRGNHYCWFILQWTMIHNASLHFFVIRWR